MVIKILIIIIFYFIVVPSQSKADCTSENPLGVITCMDFDGSNPPVDWPKSNGPAWQGWTPKWYGTGYCDPASVCDGGSSLLNTSIKKSGTRSLKVTRNAGMHDVTDLSYSFTPVTDQIYVRFYIYFDSSWSRINDDGEDEYIHLTFFNTTVAYNHVGLDINNYSDTGVPYAPTCLKMPGDRALVITWRVNNNKAECGGSGDLDFLGPQKVGGSWGGSWVPGCWDIKENLNKWVAIEHMWDIRNHRAKLWIDDVLMIDREACSDVAASINKFILSGWSSPNTGVDVPATFYVDNIVISRSKIGLLGGTPVTPTSFKLLINVE